MRSDSHIKHTGGGISWLALLLGIGLGISIGLIYTWEIDPVIERNTSPWQLDAQAREDYVVAVALSYAYNHDLNLAFDRLRSASPDRNVWSMVADITCDRVKQGKTVTNGDIRVIRALNQLYVPQGADGCAVGMFPTPAAVAFSTTIPTGTPPPTLTPPPTKTATPPIPTPAPVQSLAPTNTPPSGGYVLARLQSFCDPDVGGLIEVRVYDRLGRGVPGVAVQVTWGGNQTDTFYTGLKPEREPGYADFEMSPGLNYTITIPALVSDPPSVDAVPCEIAVDGQPVTTTASYWVNFEQRPN
jgi:hypothetical protein